MNMPELSIIVPVCNVAPYLCRCLDSLVGQALKEIEIICVDDGSTDGSSEILSRYEANDPRVRVVRQDNAGAGAARNRGMDMAKGKYLQFCDSDDYLAPSSFDRMLSNAEQENADICVCRIEQFDSNSGKAIKARPFGSGLSAAIRAGRRSVSPKEIADSLFGEAGYGPCNKIFRRAFVERKGLRFQEIRRTNDMFFVASALANAERITWVDAPLYHYRRGIASVTTTDDLSASFCEALKALKERLVGDGLYGLYGRTFAMTAMGSLVNNVRTCYDASVLKALFPQMREGVLSVLDDPSLLPEAQRRLLDLLSVQNDPLYALRWIFDRQEERLGKITQKNLYLQSKTKHLIETSVKAQRQAQEGLVRVQEKLAQVQAQRVQVQEELAQVQAQRVQVQEELAQAQAQRVQVQEELAQAQANLARMQEKLTRAKRKVRKLQRSEAYRVGMLVTWPVRQVYRILKRL